MTIFYKILASFLSQNVPLIVKYLTTLWPTWLVLSLGCNSQFDLLVELFQDEEKATSPTGAAPTTGGRTRLSVKPEKSKPGQASKEHKKTVGLQVEARSYFYFY